MTEEDLPLIRERQQQLASLSSEFDAFRLYAWLHYDHTQVAYWQNQFVLRFSLKDEACYTAPYETQDMPGLLAALMDVERGRGSRTFRYLCVEREGCSFPAGFTATPRRDLYDYVYNAADLIGMQGHAFAAKRNQVAQFKRKYDWHFAPLTQQNAADCMTVLDAWYQTHESPTLQQERIAIQRMLGCPFLLGQSGGMLYADGQPVAFAIGSHPRPQLMDVIAEKALPGYTGLYSAIIQAYAAYAYSLATFEYINREEDMGLENLRNAKLQLNPAFLIEKTLMTAEL